jgi:hypothetical protein
MTTVIESILGKPPLFAAREGQPTFAWRDSSLRINTSWIVPAFSIVWILFVALRASRPLHYKVQRLAPSTRTASLYYTLALHERN